MDAFIRAGLGIGLVLVVPGTLLLVAMRVRLSRAEWLALVPACSLGVVFVLAEVLTLVGAPFGPVAFFVLLATLGVVALLAVRRSRITVCAGAGAPVDTSGARSTSVAGALIPFGLVLGAILITSGTLLSGMQGRATSPPQHDGWAHGFVVARVAHTESISPHDVLVSDGSGEHQANDYYPLALHASLAIAHRVTGAEIGYLLNASTVFFAALVLPLGLYALTRFLMPEEPLAAPFAALLGSLLGLFPYNPVRWSAITLVAGMALVPVTVVLLTRTSTSRWSRRAAVLSGVVVMAGFALHNSQLLLILGLVGTLVIASAIRTGSTRLVADAVTRLVWIGVVAAVLSIPTLSQVASGASERSGLGGPGGEDVGKVLWRLLTLDFYGPARQGWLAVLALVGITVLVWRRQHVEWVVAAMLICAVAVIAAVSDYAPARALTFPWYGQAERVVYNLAFFVPVFGGFAVALVVRWIAQHLRWGSWSIAAGAVAVLGVLYPLTGAHAIQTNRRLVRDSYAASSPVQRESVAAFDFMSRHSDPRDSVLNDLNADASAWMYALAGVKPLFGLDPSAKYMNESWYDRIYLLLHIGDLGRDPKVDELVRRLRVRFVYFSDAIIRGGSHSMSLATLRSVPGLREVYSVGGAHVFEVTSP